MAKNDTILLDGILNDRLALEPMEVGEAFELFAFEQILKSYDLSRQEVEYGWVDGKDDGGIDGFFVFVNGSLVRDPQHFPWPRKGVTIDIVIINCKHKDSFQQQPLNTLFPSIEELLDFEKGPSDFNAQYSPQLVRIRETAVEAFRRTATALPKLHFRLVYATRGDQVERNIEARGNQLKRIVSDYFSDAEVQLDYIGATQLIALHRKSRFVLELPYEEQLAGEAGSFILLVRLHAYAKFVGDETGNLRRYLFDSNVRDFLGENRVNQDIANSLADKSSPEFWWLNNGITILATSAIPLGKTAAGSSLQLHDVQIVNGLQTTQTIHNFFSANSGGIDPRSVMVKVIVSDDIAVRDSIIRATNNQSSVELASLTATDKIQRDIEEILERHDWFYERRRNYYKNIGKPPERFIQPLYLAVSMVALVCKAPQLAARLESRFMRDPISYGAVFDERLPILVWPKLASIMKLVEAAIVAQVPRRKVGARIVGVWRGATALCAMAETFGTFAYSMKDLLELDETQVSPPRVGEIFKFLSEITSYPSGDISSRDMRRARVELRCEAFASRYGLSEPEAIGKWQLPKTPPIPVPAAITTSSSSARGAPKAPPQPKAPPRPLLDEEIEKVFSLLPAQPWPPGMQRNLTSQYRLDPGIVKRVVTHLIETGRCHNQYHGVVVSKDQTIVAVDPMRAHAKYKVGEKFVG